MKKISILSVFALAILGACTKYNENNFPGYDQAAIPSTAKAQYTRTLSDADYSNTAFPTTVRTNKYFTDAMPLSAYASAFLRNIYQGAEEGSSCNITYNFLEGVPEEVSNFTDVPYLLTADDYLAIYGDAYTGVNGLSPSRTPAAALPSFLLGKYAEAEAGKSTIIEYDYYAEVPQSVVYLDEDFENNPSGAGSGRKIDVADWANLNVESAVSWECRSYSNNNYGQITANANTADADVVSYLVTPQLDLTQATDPELVFDICVGYWVGPCLSVLVSENFDGTNVAGATWTDISANCDLPTTGNPTGYGVLTPINAASLKAFVGKKIRIAFVYTGKETTNTADRRTTTYQIDNVLVQEKPENPINPVRTAAAWTFNGTAWSAASTTTTLTLQASDYTSMGTGSALTVAQAPNYLPALLNQKLPYAQNGTVITVVYKTSSTVCRADQYTKTNGVWSATAVPVQKTEQYIKVGDGSWLFDPTVNYTLITQQNGPDYYIFANFVLAEWPGQFNNNVYNYVNEEWYYGASAYYSNFNFRLTGNATSSRDLTLGRDNELHELASDEAKVRLMWNRVTQGIGDVFLPTKFPDAVQNVSGVQVYYNVTASVYYPNGSTNETLVYTWRYKALTSGSPGVPPTFGFEGVITPEPPVSLN